MFITFRITFWSRWNQAIVFFCPTDIKSIYIVYSVTGHPYFEYDLLCAFSVVINVFIIFETLILYLSTIFVKRPIMSGFSFYAMGQRICFPAIIQFLSKHRQNFSFPAIIQFLLKHRQNFLPLSSNLLYSLCNCSKILFWDFPITALKPTQFTSNLVNNAYDQLKCWTLDPPQLLQKCYVFLIIHTNTCLVN